MVKHLKGTFQLGVAVVVALAIGAGAVFALTQPGAGVKADSVAILKAQGVTCGSCAGKIGKALKEKPGVSSVAVDVDAGRVVVAYDSKAAKPEALAETVTGLGYGSSILQTMSAEQYRAITGKTAAAQTEKTSGCACCNKK